MKPKHDSFGQEVWAYYNGENVREIIERDDGYIYISSGAAAYFAPFEEWPDHQKKASEFVKGRVLDVGCGAGRVGLHLQEKGFEVTGIDISPIAVEVSRLRGLKDARHFAVEDVRKLKPNVFDTVVLFGYNFGLFCGLKKAKPILKNLHDITSPGAVILAESEDPYIMNNPYFTDYRDFNVKRGRLPGQVRIRVRFRNFTGDWFDYIYASLDEMKKILEGTGWQVKTAIPSDGSAYMAVIERI